MRARARAAPPRGGGRRAGPPPPAAGAFRVVGAPGPGAGPGPYRLAVYTKPGCPLCEGLREKLEALVARARFLPGPLSAAELEVRDCADDAEWARRYAAEVPLVAYESLDPAAPFVAFLPRVPPRVSTDETGRRLEAAVLAAAAEAEAEAEAEAGGGGEAGAPG